MGDMLKALINIFRKEPTVANVAIKGSPYKNEAPEAKRAENVSGLIYPPQDPGLPVTAPDLLVADQAELMAMLKKHAALQQPKFTERFANPVLRIAEYVNVLPGSATSAFSGAGALFRAALELAFVTFRASDGQIFTGTLGVEARHKLENRWRYVCFLGGLLYPIGGVLSRMSVLDPKGVKWAPELESLVEWAGVRGTDRIYVTWNNQDMSMGPSPLTATLALKVIGRENLEWLNEGSPDLLKALLEIVTGAAGAKNLIADALVKEMWKAVQSKELARTHQNYGSLTIGSNVAPYLMDALVGLSKSTWELNKKVLYADKNGVYLEWPKAGADITEYCRKQNFPGIPSNESALLALLITTKFIESGVEGVGLSEIADVTGEIRAAVKLSKPGMLLPDDVTLASFGGSRPVDMDAVMEADPLAKTQPKPRKPRTPKPEGEFTPETSSKPAPVLDQLLIEEDEPVAEDLEDDGPGTTAQDVDAVHASAEHAPEVITLSVQVEQATSTPNARGAEKVDSTVEKAEIRYSDLLSRDVSQKFRPYEAELLGKLVHAWRSKVSGAKPMMRMCEHGAAVELAYLSPITRDPPAFLNALGENGMLFTAPQSPSKMVYKVPVSEGSQTTVLCFIIAHQGCRKLDIS